MLVIDNIFVISNKKYTKCNTDFYYTVITIFVYQTCPKNKMQSNSIGNEGKSHALKKSNKGKSNTF